MSLDLKYVAASEFGYQRSSNVSECVREIWSDESDDPNYDAKNDSDEIAADEEELGLRHDHGEGEISSVHGMRDGGGIGVYVDDVDEEYPEECGNGRGKIYQQGRCHNGYDDESSDYSDMADLLASLMAIFAESEIKRKQREIRKSLCQDSTRIARILKSTLDKGKKQKLKLLVRVHSASIKETGTVDVECFAIKALLAVWMDGDAYFLGELKGRIPRLSITKQRSASLKTAALASGTVRKKKWKQFRQKQRAVFRAERRAWIQESARPLKFLPLF